MALAVTNPAVPRNLRRGAELPSSINVVWDWASNPYGRDLYGVNHLSGTGGQLAPVRGSNALQVTSALAETGALSGDSDYFLMRACIYVRKIPTSENPIISRGWDGFGAGWSIYLAVVNGGQVFATCVTGNGNWVQMSSVSTSTVRLGWNCVGLSLLQAVGAEPSYIKSFINGANESRTGLTGFSIIRGSAKSFTVGAINGAYSTADIDIGRIALTILPSGSTVTEGQADDWMVLRYRNEREMFA